MRSDLASPRAEAAALGAARLAAMLAVSALVLASLALALLRSDERARATGGIERDERVESRENGGPPDPAATRGAIGERAPVALADDRRAAPASEVVELALEPALAITGAVTRPDGSALDAPAELYSLSRERMRHLGSTGADGSFELSRLTLERGTAFRLVASHRELFAWSELLRPPALDGAPLSVALRLPSEVCGIDVSVLDPEGRPAPGVLLEAYPSADPTAESYPSPAVEFPSEPSGWLDSGGDLREGLQRTTDAEGRARYERLPWQGELRAYRLRVEPPAGLGPIQPVTDPLAWPEESGEIVELIVRLRRASEVRLSGTVLDRAGLAVSGARLECQGVEVTSDEHGAFELAVPAQRDYRLRTSGPGLAHERHAITSEAAAERLSIVVQRARPIHGRVVDATGAPVPGAVVSARQDGLPALSATPRVTEADGRFAFPRAAPGEWLLEVRPQSSREEWITRPARVGAAEREVVLEVELPPQAIGTLEATLFEPGAREPFTPTRVKLEPLDDRGGPRREPRVESAPGRVRATELTAGEWSLCIEGEAGGVPRPLSQRSFRITEEEPHARLRIEVPPFAVGRLVARVHLGDGGEEPELELVWYPTAERRELDRRRFHGKLDAEVGTWTSERLPAGFVRLTSSHAGGRSAVEAEVTAGADTFVELEPAPAGRLVFRTEAPLGPRDYHLEYRLVGAERDEDFHGQGATDRPLERTATVPPGEYEWSLEVAPVADAPDLARQAGSVRVVAGETALVVIAIEEQRP